MGRNWPNTGATWASADINGALELGCHSELSQKEVNLVGSYIRQHSALTGHLWEGTYLAKGDSQ